jgi:hypothetical protein
MPGDPVFVCLFVCILGWGGGTGAEPRCFEVAQFVNVYNNMELKMAIVNNRMEKRISVLIHNNTLDILQPIFDDFLMIKILKRW